MKKIAVVIVAAIASVCIVAATPSLALDSGTITGTVIPAAPCLTVDTSAVDFGALPFSDHDHTSVSRLSPIGVTNCYGGDESLLASGTDAHSSTSSATWALKAAAACDTNQFSLTLDLDGVVNQILLHATTATSLGRIGGGPGHTLSPVLVMPCTGSSGAGEHMNFSYIVTAVL